MQGVFVVVALTACTQEQNVVARTPVPPTPPAPAPAPAPKPTPVPTPKPAPVQTGDTDVPPDPPDTDLPEPRAPGVSELVITELFIDPQSVGDAVGEWVEVYNDTADVLDLTGLSLADDNVDDALVTEVAPGSLLLAPGARLTLCADADPAVNGGVTCAGTYLYQGFGGGLALANAGDELELRLAGVVLDRFVWSDGFAVLGESLGVDPDASTAAANDDAADWCPQTAPLSGGDSGTPGTPNREC